MEKSLEGAGVLPVVFVCSNCGHALEIYVGGKSSGLPTLEKVLQYYECPYCHAKLIPDLDMVETYVYLWKPQKLEKIVKGELSEEEKKKLMKSESGRKLLKIRPAIAEVLDAYKRKLKSKRLQEEIKEAKARKRKK